jgi:hypothetical protein
MAAMGDEPLDDVALDDWALEVLARIRRHYRRDVDGLRLALADGLVDFLDMLATASLLTGDRRPSEMAEFERRRLSRLAERRFVDGDGVEKRQKSNKAPSVPLEPRGGGRLERGTT